LCDASRPVLIGDKVPEFVAQTTKGEVHFPQDFQGKWVVLFSHPADFTPVCTTEFVAFAKRWGKFQELGTQLIGLSIDQVFSHMKWTEWIREKLGVEIPFPVVADNTGKIASMFGMLHSEAGGTQTVRTVFVVDPEGIARAMLYYPMNVGRNIDEILRLVKGLQTADAEKVALPANWPNNELIGDEVIVSPPKSESEAKQRVKTYKCYDWWFCHRKL